MGSFVKGIFVGLVVALYLASIGLAVYNWVGVRALNSALAVHGQAIKQNIRSIQNLTQVQEEVKERGR